MANHERFLKRGKRVTVGDKEIDEVSSRELVRFIIQETEAETVREVELFLKWKGYWVEEYDNYYILNCKEPFKKFTVGKPIGLNAEDYS